MDYLVSLGHGITQIDTGFVRPRFDSAYLIVSEERRAAYIDTGPNSAVPRLLDALSANGLSPESVDYLIVTHVHLDHAGGAGLLLSKLPNAKLVVHPRGARHLVDPSKLMAGVRAVYGDEVAARDYGELIPILAERVIESHDEMKLSLGSRTLELIDTPGHALHHHSIWDAESAGMFTGDTFGIAYPDLPIKDGTFAFPTTSPVQFDPEALKSSIERILRYKPARIYLTHFGMTEQIERHAEMALSLLEKMMAKLPSLPKKGEERHQQMLDAFTELYLNEYERLGGSAGRDSALAQLAGDLELNAQGVGVYLDRQAAR